MEFNDRIVTCKGTGYLFIYLFASKFFPLVLNSAIPFAMEEKNVSEQKKMARVK